jgi:hypothetical protein
MNWKLLDVKENGNSGNFKGRDCLTRYPSVGIAIIFRQERALAKTLGGRFGVNAESRSDPNSGDNASVDVAIDTCAAKAEQRSDFPHRQRPLNSFNLLCKGNGWVSDISHATKDDSNKNKLTRII